VPSTNTDGLYVTGGKGGNELLMEIAASMGVAIEPESMHLISKDSNNRVEFLVEPCATSQDSPAFVTRDDDGTTILDHLWSTFAADADGRPRWVPATDEDAMRLPARLRVLSASGGSLGCRRGPDLGRAINHPAIIDWALCEYMMRSYVSHGCTQESMSLPFDDDFGLYLLTEARNRGLDAIKDIDDDQPIGNGTTRDTLLLFQNVIASNPTSYTFVFAQNLGSADARAKDDADARLEWDNGSDDVPVLTSVATNRNDPGDLPVVLQHYNRVFIVDADKGMPGATHLWCASGKKVAATTARSRRRKAEAAKADRSEECDPDPSTPQSDLYRKRSSPSASAVMVASIGESEYKGLERDVIRAQVTNLSPDWTVLVHNTDLSVMHARDARTLLDALDLRAYLSTLSHSYEANWRNA
jgi:hypothetical protein